MATHDIETSGRRGPDARAHVEGTFSRGRIVRCCRRGLSGRRLVGIPSRCSLLARAARPSLVGDHPAALEDLATPHTPRLTTIDGGGKTAVDGGARATDQLGQLEICRLDGEPEVGLVAAGPGMAELAGAGRREFHVVMTGHRSDPSR